MNKQLVLIDGNSLLFKAFYASYERLKSGFERDNNEQPVNAIRLFSFMIINLYKKYPDANFLVAFDARDTHTYRHDIAFYKANRKKQPPELYQQIPIAKEFLQLYGISWIEDREFEADDLIATYAYFGKKENYQIEIITGDKDLLQLVDQKVNVHLSQRGVTKLDSFTNSNFTEKFYGLSPLQVIDFKGLAGDSSDNIPGIYGIGKQGAIKLLQKYNYLENIFLHFDELSPVLQKKFLEGYEQGILSKKLATLKIGEELPILIEELRPKKYQKAFLISFFEEKKIFNILKKI